MAPLKVFGHTDTGRVRSDNQDSYLALALDDRGLSRHLLVVADGMGGHAGGSIASEVAVATLRESVARQGLAADPVPVRTAIETAVQDANAAVLARATADSSLQGMGTTLVAALIVGDAVWIANVGDSRAYVIRDGAIRQITIDQVWERDAARSDEFDAVQIAESPFRGMLTGSVGMGSDLDVECFEETLPYGCHLLLCSDGAYRHVSAERMLDAVSRLQEPESVCREVIALANQAGGSDNVTCVVAFNPGTRERPRAVDTVKLPTMPSGAPRQGRAP